MSTPSKAPVLIAGAGPTGLLLALTLAQNGVPVRIIDKDATFHLGQRGAGIQPRTLEIYNYLGMLPDYLKGGSALGQRCIYEMPGGVKPIKIFDMAPYEEPTPSVPFRNPWIIGQGNNEEILRAHLAKHNVFTELGTELVSFEQNKDSVTVRLIRHHGGEETHETVTVEWLIGTEGARSVVRKGLGFTFEGETRNEHRILLVDIAVENLSKQYWHQWGDNETASIYLRPTEHDKIFSLFIFGREVPYEALLADQEALKEFVKKTTNRHELIFGEIRWSSEWRPNIRMTNKFGEGRCYIAGDAAHIHSPTGGQGLNSGAQDAFNLAWKLALIYKGHAPASLLDTYNAERLPVITEMLGRTTALLEETTKFKADGSNIKTQERPKVLQMLGLNCRWSPIVVDEQPEAPEHSRDGPYLLEDTTVLFAGDRAPDSPGLVPVGGGAEETSLFKIFGPTHHTVLVFGADAARAKALLADSLSGYPKDVVAKVAVLPKGTETENAAAVEGADVSVVDRDGHAHTFYPPVAKGFAVVVVRPDGVVGAIVKGQEGLQRYFKGIFGY